MEVPAGIKEKFDSVRPGLEIRAANREPCGATLEVRDASVVRNGRIRRTARHFSDAGGIALLSDSDVNKMVSELDGLLIGGLEV